MFPAAMASSQSFTKPFRKILDPTKIGTWNVVRRPPIENHSLIQGKPREQNSNAFKTHQWKEGVRLRKALNAMTHGKNIFVYHNIRTNQVVYSLTRYLEVRTILIDLLSFILLIFFVRYRKTMSSANSSTTAKRPSPQPFEKTCGCPTTQCTSPTPRSVCVPTTSSANSPCSASSLRPAK